MSPNKGDTGEDQSKEEAMDRGRVLMEKLGDNLRQGEDRSADPTCEKDQKHQVDVFCEVHEASAQEQLERGKVERADAGDQLFIDTEDQRHRPTRDARDNVCGTHDGTACADTYVACDVAFFGVGVGDGLHFLGAGVFLCVFGHGYSFSVGAEDLLSGYGNVV